MFERLINLVRKEKVTLFIGSGFSIESGAPSVRDLKEAILSELETKKDREKHANDSLADLSDYFVEDVCKGSRNSLIGLLKDKFEYKSQKSPDHETLARIPHFHNIFTTNYDTELEDAYPKEICQIVRNDVDCTQIDDNKPVTIYKIHGDFTNPDTILITSSDYAAFFTDRQNKLMWDCIKTDFLRKNILFIGYSLEDDNILDIIKNVSDGVNRNQKDMFLIAPNIDKIKQGNLAKMHVTYYNCVAKDFLDALGASLAENITNDFRQHKINANTFARYCHLHDIEPTVSLKTTKEKDNEIEGLKSLDGKPLRHVLTFTVDKKYESIINEHDFEKDGIVYSKLPFSDIPLIHISGKDFIKGSHSVNGVVMDNEMSDIFIGPAVKTVSLTISIPSRDFLERVDAQGYSPKHGKVVLNFDGGSYKATISLKGLQQNKGTNHPINIEFNFKSKAHFSDLDEALKWIDFPDAFFSKEDFLIKEISSSMMNASLGTNQPIEHNFHNVKTYLENIKKIEVLTGEKFKVYNECNEQAFRASIAVRAYLEHQPLVVPCPNGIEFSVKAKQKPNFIDGNGKCNGMRFVITDDDGTKLTLNDKTFTIPYAHHLLKSCEVSLEEDTNQFYILDIRYKPTTYLQILSDNPASKDFPNMESIDLGNKTE